MKVKSGIIVNGLNTIIELSEKPMPVSLAAKLLRLTDDLTKENEIIEKQRRMIIEKYGDKNENNELIVDDNGNVSFKETQNAVNAQNEFNELANLEIDIIDRNITEKELIEGNIQLSISQLRILKNFLHNDDEE